MEINHINISKSELKWKFIKIPFIIAVFILFEYALFGINSFSINRGFCQLMSCNWVLIDWAKYFLLLLFVFFSVLYILEKKMIMTTLSISVLLFVVLSAHESYGVQLRTGILPLLFLAQTIVYGLDRDKPAVLIIGAQKSGTSSLYHYLAQHPMIQGSKIKEIGYFSKDENYSKGKVWYLNQFSDSTKSKRGLYFEATPEYLYQKSVPKRIHDFNPKTKLIVVLREPIERAFSAWNMFREMHKQVQYENLHQIRTILKHNDKLFNQLAEIKSFPSFDTFVSDDIKGYESERIEVEPSFVRRGIYYEQLLRYYSFFPKEQLLIIGYRDLINNTIKVLNEILAFLELPQSDWNFLNLEIKNKGEYDSIIDESLSIQLQEFYKNHNEKLFNLIGKEINW